MVGAAATQLGHCDAATVNEVMTCKRLVTDHAQHERVHRARVAIVEGSHRIAVTGRRARQSSRIVVLTGGG